MVGTSFISLEGPQGCVKCIRYSTVHFHICLRLVQYSRVRFRICLWLVQYSRVRFHICLWLVRYSTVHFHICLPRERFELISSLCLLPATCLTRLSNVRSNISISVHETRNLQRLPTCMGDNSCKTLLKRDNINSSLA